MIEKYGFNETMKQHFEAYTQTHTNPSPFYVGRIVRDYGTGFYATTDQGEVKCIMTGKLRHESDIYPVLGDFVVLTQADRETSVIHHILPRRTAFERKEAGDQFRKQVQGANFDTVFLVTSMNHDFNPRKIERFVLTAWDTGATPVLILSKSDVCPNPDELLYEAELIAPGVNIHPISSVTGEGLDAIEQYLIPHQTIALFGASGVGKSTLINTLMGEEVMDVKAIREDDSQGRHTTTHRELLVTPNHTLLMDTPGMRELGLWDDGSGIDQTFNDIVTLASNCKFRDCTHKEEPGCAVQKAITDGDLDAKRLSSYIKLKKEAAFIQRKAARAEKKVQKLQNKSTSKHKKAYS